MAGDTGVRQDESGPKTITVSRETLRAELLSLELRLTEKLVSKAEYTLLDTRVSDLSRELETLSRTALIQGGPIATQVKDLTDKMLTEKDVRLIVSDEADKRQSKGWSSRERWMALIVGLVAVATIVLNIVLAAHNWSPGGAVGG